MDEILGNSDEIIPNKVEEKEPILNEKSENIKSSLIYESKKDAKADEDNIEELEDFLDDLL
jgi:hypothetical protein